MDLGINGLEQATQIGSGASAVVYRARQSDLGRDVAVKVLSSVDEDFVRRFKREARTLGKLSQNPGIVTVYDFGETASGQPYLVLELCSSSLLEQVKTSGPLEPRHACAALADVCDAVGEAHDIGVVHRDIKPGNILISPNQRYLITDFGISTVSGATMGQTSTVGFTAGYAAPETFQSGESGPPTDVYALGATLFHLVTGNPPFINPDGETNLLAVLHRVSTEPVPDLRPTGIPDSICQVIEACMAKHPNDRPTVQQLAAQLRHINQTGELAFPFPTPAEPHTSSTSSENSPLNTDSTVAMAQGLDVGAQQSPGGLPPTTRQTPAALSGEEQQYVRRLEPEQKRSSRGLIVMLMVAAVALVGAVIATSLLSGQTDTASTPEAEPTENNADEVVTADEVSAEDDNLLEEDPQAPTTISENEEALGAILIPDTKGSTEREAGASLEASGLRYRIEYISSTSIGEGVVIRTSPRGGTQTSPTTVVVVVVSSGSETFAVDDVVGKSEQAAISTLTASGFNPVVITESSNSTDEGLVIRTDPTADQRIGKGAAVTVVVSSGPDGCTGSEIPNVVGESERVASSQLEDNGLTVSVAEKLSTSVTAGNVISTTPPASTCVEAASTVNLVISCQAAVVPDLAGEDGSDLSALTAAGFNPTETDVQSNSVPAGTIISTSPTGGTSACTPSPITVSISSGSGVCDVKIPDLAGRAEAAAETALTALGLTASVETIASPTVAAGLVIGSNPTAATEVCAASTVVVRVSSGPTCVQVALPNVVGSGQVAAMTQLTDFAATIVREDDSAPVDEVIRTSPAAGTQVCPGDAVTVFVSNGPTTTTANPNLVAVPDVVGKSTADGVALLRAAGFGATQRTQLLPPGSPNIGKVIDQSPIGGTKYDPATRRIIITVGLAEP